MRARIPKVCVAIASTEAADLVDKAEALVRDNLLLEFRLDYLKTPVSVFPKIKKFLELHPDVVAIATCRRAVNGGKFRGSATAQLEILLKAVNAGCQIVDLELESAESLKTAEMDKLRSLVAVLLSYHDFKTTKKLDETFARMKLIPAEFYKLVSTATSLHDNVVMMKFLQANRDQYSLIGLCMGEQGIISRVLGVRAGSIFTFGSAGAGEETAPGQVSARELRNTYRIEMVDGATKVYGVAGDPVSHSLSPILMNAAFRRENVNAVYVPLHAKKLTDLIACVQGIPIHGLSVTMPYKQDIVEELDNSDVPTQKTGACNTVVRAQDGRLYGFNTDVYGVWAPLEQRMNLQEANILLLGAGGAARAAVFGLKGRGAEVYILNRTVPTAQKLARKAGAKCIKRADLKKQTFDVIINATPLGMGQNKQSALEEKELKDTKAKYFFDLVYNPAETRLMKMAAAAGMQVIGGVEMFVQQGAHQFEIWTGKPAPIAEMQFVVNRELQTRATVESAGTNGNSKHTAKKVAKKK